MLHQSLESGEGDSGGDVIASFIQGADLIVFDHLPLGGRVLHRQGEGTWRVNKDTCMRSKAYRGKSRLGSGLHFNTLESALHFDHGHELSFPSFQPQAPWKLPCLLHLTLFLMFLPESSKTPPGNLRTLERAGQSLGNHDVPPLGTRSLGHFATEY